MGNYATARFIRGELIEQEKGETKEKDGTLVEFRPDRTMFPDYTFDPQFIDKRLWRYAYLNAGLKLYLDKTCYHSANGLLDLLDKELDGENIYTPIYYRDAILEFAFSHTDAYGRHLLFLCQRHLYQRGRAHIFPPFVKGYSRASTNFPKKNLSARMCGTGLSGRLAIKIKDPVFESQTKNKLGNTEIRSWIVGMVKDAVSSALIQRHRGGGNPA